MSQRAFRYSGPSVLVFGLLLIGAAGAAAAEESLRLIPQARPDFRAVAPPPAKGCEFCVQIHQKCFASCFTGAGKRAMAACLTACDKAAARCQCDGPAALRSEDLVDWGVVSLTKAGCHPSVLCPSSYASCAGWSGPSQCDAVYCQDESWCGDPWCDNGCDPDGGPASHAPYEQFRVCFDPFGNSCTEWVSYDAVFCGC